MIALGLEGSANKLGVGIISHPSPSKPALILGQRPPYLQRAPGEGFLPKDTAKTTTAPYSSRFVKRALPKPAFSISDMTAYATTAGPAWAPPLQSVAVAARMPDFAMGEGTCWCDHCVGHIEMGRGSPAAPESFVLYVSGGNTQ